MKVGDKYIIEIGEVYETLENSATANNEQVNKPTFLYRIKGFNSLVFDEDGLDKLQQVNLETVQELAYQRGLNDAWETARKICVPTFNGGLSCNDVYSIFMTSSFDTISHNYTASEAIAKLKAYEEQKNAEEEEADNIKVGDEVVRRHTELKFLVTAITDKGENIDCIDPKGETYGFSVSDLEKTGRHFSGIADVLEKLKEGEG